MISQIPRLWRTVKHLRAEQIIYRIWNRIYLPVPDSSPAPSVATNSGALEAFPLRERELVGPGDFRMLGQQHSLAEVGWDGEGPSKLWRYNQHYFNDLVSDGWFDRATWHRELIFDWVENNAVGAGSGWEPYPTSLRIVNWIKWALGGGILEAPALQSLAVQARWLSMRLERHLLGNHLFANAKALIFAGCFFEGDEPDAWFRLGASILKVELDEQILQDGGHFELSPMYHALALEDVLDLINVLRHAGYESGRAQSEVLETLKSKVAPMATWMLSTMHPDGEIAFFNDAAFGIAHKPGGLLQYAERLGFSLQTDSPLPTKLEHSGYIRLESDRAVAIIDHAKVGPDYLPGHAHADTLSFEFSIARCRVFVNSGTSVYGTGLERLRQRGTAAHNTVIIEGQNSTEVWSGFRVGRRAMPMEASVNRMLNGRQVAEACHDGYRYLPGSPTHCRKILLEEGRLVVHDSVGTSDYQAVARFHFHPSVRVYLCDNYCGLVDLPDGTQAHFIFHAAEAHLETTSWHPRFGVSQPNQCLALLLEAGTARFELTWS